MSGARSGAVAAGTLRSHKAEATPTPPTQKRKSCFPRQCVTTKLNKGRLSRLRAPANQVGSLVRRRFTRIMAISFQK